ncbi:MAG: hypothetical protein GX596_05820, partial [Propionibacterium sp.]|nr:hypothetical protein [Propionibacterium sp.]
MGARLFLTLMAAFALLLGHAPQATAAPVVHAAHAGSKTVGLSTYVWGSVTESGAQEVWTEVQLPSGWSRSQASRTDAGGGYTIELTYGFTTPGQYRFRVGSRTHAGVVYSPVFTLTRTAWQPGWAVTKPILQTTNTWGTVPLAAGRSVWTEAMVDGRWSRSQTRIANATGYFVVPLTYGASQARPQTFRVGASTPRGTVYSQAFVLTRTGSVEAHTAGTKQVGQVTNTWGTVRGHGGGQVWTQVIVNGSWSTSQVRTASASGYFVIPLTYGATTPGSYTYRVGAATPSGTVYSSPFTLRRTAPTPSDLVERWRGQDIESFPTTRPVVALTFDGGADNSAVDRILATLEANDVPAT